MINEEEQKKGGDSKILSDYRSSSIGSFSNLFKAANERDAQKQIIRHGGTFVGTPLYVAPEMLENNYSGRFSDLWALGCILFQMLAGQTPFQSDTKDDVF
jgi:serine/threonine protein kinase